VIGCDIIAFRAHNINDPTRLWLTNCGSLDSARSEGIGGYVTKHLRFPEGSRQPAWRLFWDRTRSRSRQSSRCFATPSRRPLFATSLWI